MAHRRLLLTLACGALALSACSASVHSVAPTTTARPGSSTTTLAPPSPPIQLTDIGLTPTDWVPIDYGHAQIAVPATWDVTAPPACYNSVHDDVILGAGGGTGDCFSAGMPTDTVQIQPYPSRQHGCISCPQPYIPTKVIHLNGFLVRKTIDGANYDVPSLGVSLDFFAHTDRQVLDTLTRSPRAVALGHTGAPRIPASWHRITFAGLSFAVPEAWAVTRTGVATLGGPICSPLSDMTTTPPTITLSTDRQPAYVYGCPLELFAGQRPVRPQLGLIVNAQSEWTPTFVARSSECRRQGGLLLCVDTNLNEGILEVSMARVPTCDNACPPVPVIEHPASVELGLAGSGLVDRTILDSFRAG
jgi:hypothetical protein